MSDLRGGAALIREAPDDMNLNDDAIGLSQTVLDETQINPKRPAVVRRST